MVLSRPRLDIASYQRLTELADYVVPFAIRVVCDLKLADHLIDGPRTVEDLAAATSTHVRSLYRVLRALACRGIFAETADGRFELTPLAEPLRSDHRFSLQACFPLMSPDMRAWARMDQTLRTGAPIFPLVNGAEYYEYFAEPERADGAVRLELSVESVNAFVLRTVLAAYEWGRFTSLVDVGGGYGSFVMGILLRHRRMTATILDQPHVVAEAARRIALSPVADRCTVVAGDFRASVPAGADAYLLKTVLHDWPDRVAIDILRGVRNAMHDDARLLVVEPVRRPGNEADIGKLMDVKAMVLFGGRARSEEDFRQLFGAAGLELSAVVPTATMWLLEGRPT